MGVEVRQPAHKFFEARMGVPDAVSSKLGSMPDISGMSKEELTALVKQLHDQSCTAFADKYYVERDVKIRDAEILILEADTTESNGTFKIPPLKKVPKFKVKGEED